VTNGDTHEHAFLARTPPVWTPVRTELPCVQGFDIEGASRTMEIWRQSSTVMAVPVLDPPGLAVPAGIAERLPVAVQIIAPRFREDLCLAAADAIEARAPRITPIDPRH
jgi:amidase